MNRVIMKIANFSFANRKVKSFILRIFTNTANMITTVYIKFPKMNLKMFTTDLKCYRNTIKSHNYCRLD